MCVGGGHCAVLREEHPGARWGGQATVLFCGRSIQGPVGGGRPLCCSVGGTSRGVLGGLKQTTAPDVSCVHERCSRQTKNAFVEL